MRISYVGYMLQLVRPVAKRALGGRPLLKVESPLIMGKRKEKKRKNERKQKNEERTFFFINKMDYSTAKLEIV